MSNDKVMLDRSSADRGKPYAQWDEVEPEIVCFICSAEIKISVSAMPKVGEEFAYECECGYMHHFLRKA